MTEGGPPFGRESADEFARIDLISNHTVFQHQEQYQAFLRGQDLPVDTFSSFVHEATHHWCFTSPVGTALSLLYLSVVRNARQYWATGNKSLLNEALNDLAVFQIATDSLRPLNEGLAQFAEYDILPSENTSLVSPPLSAALLHLFKLPRRLANPPKDDRTVLYELADDIARWRLSRKTIDRKSELLLQPIGTHRGAYLLGYLAVKQLWKNAARFRDELNEPDVFLIFLRKLVLGDFSLVAEILDRKQPPRDRGIRFLKLFHERLQAIRLMTFGEDIPWSEWQKILAPPAHDASSEFLPADMPFAGLDTRKLTRKGFNLFWKLLRELSTTAKLPKKFLRDISTQVPAPVETIELITLTWTVDIFNLIRERRLMWLGDFPATWVSHGPKAGRIMVEGNIFLENFTLTKTSRPNFEELRLDMYVSLYDDYQLVTVSNDTGVFGFIALRELSERAKSQLNETRLNQRETVRALDEMRETIDDFVARTNYREVLGDFWRTWAGDNVDGLYSMYAFNCNEAAQNLLTKRGLADLLQNDSTLVRNVAAISLAASSEMSPERLLCMSDVPLDPLDTIRKVDELWTVDDFPLVGIREDGFLTSAL